jgi:diadenosine tetraphosphatase ApaH/serine/threonine PP2A family protein phosphatase
MRVALLSDVHANLTALDAVLADLPQVEEIWVMGDTVGYGPLPSETLARLLERGAHLVAGNHDVAVANGHGLELFNPVAAEAARLHARWLSDEEKRLLGSLPLTLQRSDVTFFHGSLREPLWEYVFDARIAAPTLALATTPLCVCGHTHVPALYRSNGAAAAAVPVRAGQRYPLEPKVLVNPGSVGQPRDGDARASWAVLDTAAGITFGRTAYDVPATQRAMRERALPPFLIERLAAGL